MSTSKHFNRICAVVMVLCLAITLMLCFPDAVGIQTASKTLGYESRLFDTSYVHSIDIVMDDWDSFIENCESEEYSSCAVVIDGESYKNIAIRAKGNTSLSQVANYGSDRYSFKLEFDHYNDATTYHGLDKLCLNNIIQDNTYMKDYLCYTMMNYAGVSSPLCSFAFITVNGEDWGLYLAVEAVEDSFLERNYSGTGNLYKPDSMSMGGGRGNGKNFDQDDFDFSKFDKFNAENNTSDSTDTSSKTNFQPSQMGNFGGGKGDKGGFGGMDSDDVKLIYTDDDFDSYENIFDSAKTDITDSDKTRLINSIKVLNSDDAASTVDVNAVIKYFAVHNFVCNFDSYTGSMIHNYYLYENDGMLSMIPWDYNLAFGGFVGGSDSTSMINYPIDSPVSGGDTDSRPMLAWIFSDEEYTELYHEALSEFIANYFESGYFGEEIDRVTALISPYVEKDPTKFCTYDEFTEGVAALKEFCTLRAESVRGQLDGTIPSTSDAQSEDSSALISGSSVSISAMGSMNVGGGMGGGRQDGGFGTPPNGNFGEFNGTPPEMPNSDNSDGQMPSFDGDPPEPPNGEAPSGDAPQPPTNSEASGNTSSDEPQTEQQTDGSSADTEKAETSVPEQNEQTVAPSDGTNAPESPSSEASQTEPSGKTSEDASSEQQPDENTDTSETTESTEQNSGNAFPSPDQNGNNGQNRPQMPSDGGSPASASSSNTKTVVLLCVSAGALITSILLTKLFKDRI